MPIKMSKSQAIRDRNTGKVTIQHDYIKSYNKKDLIEKYNDCKTPKLKQKIKNELIRRGGVVFE